MKKYDSYKDSGVEWIGEIPSHFEMTKLKYGVDLIGEKGNPQLNDVKISPENVESDTGKCFNLFSDYTGEGLKFRNGDVLLNKLRLYLKKIVITECDGYSMGEMIVLRCNDKLNNKFLYYLLFNQGLINLLDSQSTGVKLPRVSPEIILNSEIVYPPLTVQTQFVQYLDTKTNLIDTLIQKTQEKINLLREKRTSLINHTVTKGLNPHVEMKDSGVEWIGKIPGHWDITKVKFQFNIEGGGTPSKEKKEYWDGDIPWVSPKDMKSDEIVDSEDKITMLGLTNSSSKLIQPNSLLIVVRSGILQRTIPISINLIPVSINQDLKSLTPKNDFPIKFMYYFIKGNEINLLKDWSKEGTTVESIEMEFMTNSVIPYPPKTEQQQIIEYLDEQTQLIDNLVQKEEKRIELLKEYRQSLISDVVTGKIKVTDHE